MSNAITAEQLKWFAAINSGDVAGQIKATDRISEHYRISNAARVARLSVGGTK